MQPQPNAAHRGYRLKIYRLLLSAGLFITSFTSLILLAWHERIIAVVPTKDYPFFLYPPHISGIPKQPNGRQLPDEWPPVLSTYTEPPSSTDVWYTDLSSQKPTPKAPLPMRNVHSHNLTRLMFPRMSYSSTDTISTICNNIPSLLPIDDFGSTILDPYLPWIHDLFISHDSTVVNVIAQNRRRCHKGKFHNDDLKYWEGQVSLFQPIAIKRVDTAANYTNANYNHDRDGSVQYRLSNHKEADSDGIETRFLCRFKSLDLTQQTVTYAGETLSTYPFNYEFVNWRKTKHTMVEDGKEQSFFWLSPLMFNCPIPTHLQSTMSASTFLLDIIPFRTPTRRNDRDGFFFHDGHGGPMTFDADKMWGKNHIFPKAEDSGRWENLPVCGLKKPLAKPPTKALEVENKNSNMTPRKPHRLVACTWTSALHQRRGNERRISDGKARLREWIAFNLLVGFDHVYIFDNTGANATIFRLKNEVDPDFGNDTSKGDQHRIHDDLSSVTDLFPSSQVTRIDWPATICNNNRPAHNDPGERSSQYAAEAACRTRYGPYTDWMASMDPDEYFVPMGNYTSWKEILDKVDRVEQRKILKFRSTRARPLLSTLV